MHNFIYKSMWYALKWGSQCLVIWGLSLFSTSAIFRDYFLIFFLMYSTCIKTCQLFIAHHYVISFKDKCHWEWLLSLSGYWVKICFVGSRVLLRDIEDPSGSAKLFTKSGSESQIKMCILFLSFLWRFAWKQRHLNSIFVFPTKRMIDITELDILILVLYQYFF